MVHSSSNVTAERIEWGLFYGRDPDVILDLHRAGLGSMSGMSSSVRGLGQSDFVLPGRFQRARCQRVYGVQFCLAKMLTGPALLLLDLQPRQLHGGVAALPDTTDAVVA